MAFELLLSYQHNVQAFLLRHADKYSGVIIPLSVATAFQEGTDGFIRALCKVSPNKTYMIDPRSPLFQSTWDRESKREAHEKMAAQLGRVVVSTLAAGRPLEVADFDEDAVEDMVRVSLGFQLEFGRKNNAKLKKYAKLAGVDVELLGVLSNPRRLIPPYFRFVNTNDPWYEISLILIEAAQEHLDSLGGELQKELCPVLHVRGLSDDLDWREIAGELAARQIENCFVYPNNFREADATVAELQRYRSAVEGIAEFGLSCYSLHGGYFAAMLSKFGLAGFGNGVGYGEWRDSSYHRGGQANVRIYIPKLHRFVQANEALILLSDFGDFFAEDSDLLSSLLRTGGSALSVTTEQANDHFLECRAAEQEFLNASNLDAVRGELQSTVEGIASVLGRCSPAGKALANRYSDTLVRWVQAI